jgi:hypothetical protein
LEVLEDADTGFRFLPVRFRAAAPPSNFRVASRAMACIRSPDAFAVERCATLVLFLLFEVWAAMMSPRRTFPVEHPTNKIELPAADD